MIDRWMEGREGGQTERRKGGRDGGKGGRKETKKVC